MIKKALAVFTGIFVTLTPGTLMAASNAGTTAMNFSSLGHSVKTVSLGYSQVARKGSRSFTVNPAAIVGLNEREVSAQYVGYIEDVGYKNIGMVIPVGETTVAIDAGIIDYGLQDRTTISDKTGSELGQFRNIAYQVLVGVAKRVRNVDSGVSLKYLEEELDGETLRALGLNSGVMVKLNEKWSVGGAFNNFTVSKARATFSSAEADLETEIRVGTTYKTTMMKRALSISTDIIHLNDDSYQFGAGISHNLNSILQVRAGYNTVSDISKISLGLGLNLNQSYIDFAYRPGDLFGPSYRIGLGLKL